MTQQPILDYASPRPRESMRLPARSLISMHWDDDNEGVRIFERVEALAGAIVAMLFACFVLLLLAGMVVSRVRPGRPFDSVTIPIGTMWLIEAGVLLLVIAQTWRRTILHARDGVLTLRFINLFGTKEYRWPFHMIDGMQVIATQNELDKYVLAELQFRVAGATPVHLYTDHLEREVREIHDALEWVIQLPRLDSSASVAVQRPWSASSTTGETH